MVIKKLPIKLLNQAR